MINATSATVATKGGGNTSTPPKDVQSRKWCFTINNPDVDIYEKLCDKFSSARRLVFQLEQGEKETKHIQGFVLFKGGTRFSTIKKMIPTAHIEKAKGSVDDNYKYCTKLESRIKEPGGFGFPKPLDIISELRPWQKELVNKLKEKPDDRTINWYWEKTGKVGKTSLAKYLCVHSNALYLNGKAADMKYAIVQHFLQEITNRDDLTIVVGLSRSMENYVSYQGIEEIKDGIWFSGKYEAKMEIYNSPHILVLANFKPDIHKLSSDRWNVVEIG